MTAVPSRPLSRRERELLDWLLAVEFPGADTLRQQARLARARCDDPRPPWRGPFEGDLVVFHVQPRAPLFPFRDHVPVGADSRTHGRKRQIMILVDVDAGMLFSLRLLDLTQDGGAAPAKMPAIEDFHSPYRNYATHGP